MQVRLYRKKFSANVLRVPILATWMHSKTRSKPYDRFQVMDYRIKCENLEVKTSLLFEWLGKWGVSCTLYLTNGRGPRQLYRQMSVLWTKHTFQSFFLTVINLSAFPFHVARIYWNFRRCSFSCKKYLINKVYSPTFSWFLPLVITKLCTNQKDSPIHAHTSTPTANTWQDTATTD